MGSLLGDYPDLLAFAVVIVVALLTGFGARSSTMMNTIFVFVNLGVIAFVVIYGFTFANFTLWTPFNQPEKGLCKAKIAQ
jgi:amino acid transporter